MKSWMAACHWLRFVISLHPRWQRNSGSLAFEGFVVVISEMNSLISKHLLGKLDAIITSFHFIHQVYSSAGMNCTSNTLSYNIARDLPIALPIWWNTHIYMCICIYTYTYMCTYMYTHRHTHIFPYKYHMLPYYIR